MRPLRTIFMGTPEFAVPSLAAIHESKHHVVGVVTQPDRQRGRGRKLLPTSVKYYAREMGIEPVLQPEKMKDGGFQEALRQLNADVFVVVAFRILPAAVFEMPPLGTINLHPSLLPQLRGAAPLNWAIINGLTVSGISTIFIRKEIDAGNIILQRPEKIATHETAGDIHDRFAQIGAQMIVESLDKISSGPVATTAQDPDLVTPAPKITREMCYLDFDQPATGVKNWIHGLSPFPGAIVTWQGKQLKLLRANVSSDISEAKPGTVVIAGDDSLEIACNPGQVRITELQLQGRKALKTADFLRGTPLKAGDHLDRIEAGLP